MKARISSFAAWVGSHRHECWFWDKLKITWNRWLERPPGSAPLLVQSQSHLCGAPCPSRMPGVSWRGFCGFFLASALWLARNIYIYISECCNSNWWNPFLIIGINFYLIYTSCSKCLHSSVFPFSVFSLFLSQFKAHPLIFLPSELSPLLGLPACNCPTCFYFFFFKSTFAILQL